MAISQSISQRGAAIVLAFAAVLGAEPLFASKAQIGSPGVTQEGARKRVFGHLPPGTPLPRLMPLGDSITEGVGAFGGYRRPLWERLVQDGTPYNFVGTQYSNSQVSGMDPDHEGHGGYRVQDLIAWPGTGGTNGPTTIQGWVSAASPDVVLLHIGTNDLFSPLDWERAALDMDVLLDGIWSVKPSAVVIAAEIIPTGADEYNLQVESLNRSLIELANQKHAEGRPIRMVNHYDEVGFFASGDGSFVHPNLDVYSMMADVWKSEIDRLDLPVVLPAPMDPALSATLARSNGSTDFHVPSFVIDGSNLDPKGQLHLAEGAPASLNPASWRSKPFNVVWQAGPTATADPAANTFLALTLEQESHVSALHLWNGRTIEFLTEFGFPDFRVYDTMRTVRISTVDALGMSTDRGVFSLRRPPRVRSSPGEVLEVDWHGVLEIRIEPEQLDPGTFSPDAPLGQAIAAFSEIRAHGTPQVAFAETSGR